MFTKWFGPGRAIPLYTIIFGVLSIAMAFVTNLGSGCAVRFLLGAAEAGMLPGIAYYLSRWYPKRELAFRLAMYLGEFCLILIDVQH
jgi:MFS family permease